MAYQLVNGAVINGEEASELGLYPVSLGAAAVVVNLQGLELTPLLIGDPSLKSGTDVILGPISLVLRRLGDAVLEASSPPGTTVYPAESLSPVSIGNPNRVSRNEILPASIAGIVSLTSQQVCTAFRAEAISSPILGMPSVKLTPGAASGLAQTTIGRPTVALSAIPTSVIAARIGASGFSVGGVQIYADSIQLLAIGDPARGGVGVYGRSIFPARIGAPTLHRGSAC